MDVILGPEVQEFVFKYVDYLLVTSPSLEAHLGHLRQLFQELQEKTEFSKL